jgi:hypothetical protein
MYVPLPIGGDYKDPDVQRLAQYLIGELRTIGNTLETVDSVELVKLHVEPSKPRVGLLVYADGSDWNPGSGVGFYGYSGSAWVKLG